MRDDVGSKPERKRQENWHHRYRNIKSHRW